MFTACLLTLVLALPAHASVTENLADDALATGPAGCAVQVGERVLMVRDIWSHRWGLPGGGHDANETARQTAERETFEETGLRVVAGDLLWVSPSNFSVYRCAPTSAGITVHPNGALVLPRAGYDELIEARLLRLGDIPEARLRYPSQRAALLAGLESPGLPDSVLRTPPAWGPFFALEIPVIAALQAKVAWALGAHGDTAMRACSQLGSTAVMMAVILLVWFLAGWRAGIEMAYALFLTCLVSVIAKACFGWPRPFHLDPTLQRDGASSFGFPSAHTVCATMLWGLVAQRVRWPGRWWTCAALVAACALSRVALGVHFIHDVVAGGLLGALACGAYHAHRAYHRGTQISLRTWRAVAATLGAVALWVHPQPSTLAICALLLGFTMGGWVLQRRDGPMNVGPSHWRLQPDLAWRAASALVAGLLVAGLLYGAPKLVPIESSFWPQLGVHVLMYWGLGSLLAIVDVTADILQPPRACASHVA